MNSAYYVGFLQAVPDDLPAEISAHVDYEKLQQPLTVLLEQNNKLAKQLLRVLSVAGQNYLKTVDAALQRPSDQNMVTALFMTIEHYFADVCPGFADRRDIKNILQAAQHHCVCEAASDDVKALLALLPEQADKVRAMLVLSAYCETLLFPVFGQTDAVGSVMRKKITHLVEPLQQQIRLLRN